MIDAITEYNLYRIDDFEAAGFTKFVHKDPFIRYDMTRRGIRKWDKTTDDYFAYVLERFRQKRIEYIVLYNTGPNSRSIVTNRKDRVYDMISEEDFSDAGISISRTDWPAVIRLTKHGKVFATEWWVNNVDITPEVNEWIDANQLPMFTKWTDEHKMAYKQAFA